MAVMADIESSTPTSYSSPIACMDLFAAVWPQTNYFRFLLPVFKTASRNFSEAKLTSKSHRNESTERMKLVRPPVELNYRSDGRYIVPKPEVEIWRKPENEFADPNFLFDRQYIMGLSRLLTLYT